MNEAHVTIDQPHLTDTLRFRVQVEKSLPQETVRVGVRVLAIVRGSERDNAAIEARIREALRAFIDAPWALSRIARSAEAAGYERVQLRATTRVSAAENHNLAERANAASREGLKLDEPGVSYGLSSDKIGEVVDELRLAALARVQTQVEAINRQTGRAWRIGDVLFGTGDPRATSKGAYRDDNIDQLLEAMEDDTPVLHGAERVVLLAAVTLKSAAAGRGKNYVINERL
ncbi:MAG: hypothetical protein ACREUW_10015 [Burkholderiales bacterium]